MKRIIPLALCLAWASTAHAHICTYDANDPLKARFLVQAKQTARNQYHNWMHTTAAAAQSWAQKPIKDILLAGSHDAGTFGASGSKLPDKWGSTQTYSFLDQLCLGARWFDVRLRRTKAGEWKIFHSNFEFGTYAETVNQFKQFIEDPTHADEIVFVRIKLDEKDKATPQQRSALLQNWIDELTAHLVKKSLLPNGKQMGGFGDPTPAEIRAAAQGNGNGGRIVLLEYPKDQSLLAQNSKDWFFNYNSDQTGTFSNKVALKDLRNKQRGALEAAKGQDSEPFALWWTSTGKFGKLNVKNNTKKLWPTANPGDTELEKFYIAQDCDIGTFLIVDFFGDHALQGQNEDVVMKLVADRNTEVLNGRKPTLCKDN